MLEEPENDPSKLHREEKLEFTAKVLIEKEEVPYKDGDKIKGWRGGMNIPPGKVDRAVCELERRDIGQHKFCVTSANTDTNRFDENENITDKRRSDSACCVLDDDDKKVQDRAKELSKQEKVQTLDPGIVEDAELSNGQSSKVQNSVYSYSTSKQESKESVNRQIKQETDTEAEKVAPNRSYVLGYFTGKLSEAYKDAGRRLQGTRDIIRNVRAAEMKVVLSQYVTMMSKELPLIHRLQLKPEPEPCIPAKNKVRLIDLSRDCALNLPQNCGMSTIPGASGWPEGSVSSLRNTCPEVFYQRLVQLPPALSQLHSLSGQKMLEKLESLAPRIKVNKLKSVFWIKTANRMQPIPKPGCLLLSGKDIMVLSSGTNSADTLTVSHHFNLMEIKKVQISLAGQHVRLIGFTEDIILVVFTHSKELTQEFCKALLKVLSPEKVPDHPLLSGDLMVLSLDWTSNVPDLILDNGIHVTSRFKRVLADLLYIVHGNMDGPGKPSLAHICPLLYTSVKVKNSTRLHQDAIVHFLLTDTHVALLREDGVFHPVPRGSSVVPAQPQFKGLELRKRSDIGCLFVRQDNNCLVVDITFKTRKQQERKVESRRGSVEVTSSSPSDSWKLCFGCTSEAVILINHMCT